MCRYTVDRQQLKQMGARSAGLSAACICPTPTACVHSMTTWEIPGTCKLDKEEEAATAAWRGSGRRMTACWALLSLHERPTPSSFTAAVLGPARACGEARNRAANSGRKWMGADATGACEPHGGSPRGQPLPRCTLDLWLGARVGLWGGGHIRGDSIPGRRWATESERGPRERSVLSPTGSSPG